MTNRRPEITAAQLAARLQEDPEFAARQQERERALSERVSKQRAEQTPIVEELVQNGVKIERLPDLIMRSIPYRDAIPILLKHLVLPYSDVTKETLARALAVPDARAGWHILVSEYVKAKTGDENGIRLGAKDGLAAALSAASTDDVIDQLAALAKDQSHGSSRVLLLTGLRRSKNPLANKAIEELASDPALAKEIASWKERRRKR